MNREEAIHRMEYGEIVINVDCGAMTRYRIVGGVLRYLQPSTREWLKLEGDIRKLLPNADDYELPDIEDEQLKSKSPDPRDVASRLMNEEKQAYIPGLGTIRECLDCGCLIAGGPTRCKRCASTCEA